MSFDLSDTKTWEWLFVSPKKSVEGTDDADDAADENKGSEDAASVFEVSRAFDAPPSWVDPLTMVSF